MRHRIPSRHEVWSLDQKLLRQSELRDGSTQEPSPDLAREILRLDVAKRNEAATALEHTELFSVFQDMQKNAALYWGSDLEPELRLGLVDLEVYLNFFPIVRRDMQFFPTSDDAVAFPTCIVNAPTGVVLAPRQYPSLTIEEEELDVPRPLVTIHPQPWTLGYAQYDFSEQLAECHFIQSRLSWGEDLLVDHPGRLLKSALTQRTLEVTAEMFPSMIPHVLARKLHCYWNQEFEDAETYNIILCLEREKKPRQLAAADGFAIEGGSVVVYFNEEIPYMEQRKKKYKS